MDKHMSWLAKTSAKTFSKFPVAYTPIKAYNDIIELWELRNNIIRDLIKMSN
jgi:hypothetical protein